MRISDDITKLVGNTPLVRLNRLFSGAGNLVAAKLEQFNPCSSVKDRPALAIINDAESRGLIREGSTLIEATSGNMGVALSFIAAARGYRLIVVMPESMSLERQRLFSIFGAKVELTPAHLGMKGSIDKARELKEKLPDAFLIGQFDHPANPAVHGRTTAEEILADTDQRVDLFFAGVGTGGTITGVGRRLKKHNPAIQIVAAEPANSNVLSGGRCGPHLIQGIGAGFIPSILDRSVIDEVVTVEDVEAMAWTRELISREGILAGISSGAVACAAAKYLKKHAITGKIIVLLFPDTGERYLSLAPFLENKR